LGIRDYFRRRDRLLAAIPVSTRSVTDRAAQQRDEGASLVIGKIESHDGADMALADRRCALTALLILLTLAGCAPAGTRPAQAPQAPYHRDDNDMH
jgi:hypothetical protein